VFVVSGLAIVASVAVLSWLLIEQPALGHKHSPLPDRIATMLSRRRRPRHGRTPMPTEGRSR
jgi:hypothetical protein